MICPICGKKQSVLLNGSPLSNTLDDIKICGTCDENLKKLKNPIYYDCKARNVSYTYFKQRLKTVKDIRAQDYLSQLLCNFERQAEEEQNEEKRQQEEAAALQIEKERLLSFPMTNGFNFDGKRILRYIKVINAECVMGTGFISEWKAAFSDLLGIENQAFAEKMQYARDVATEELIKKAIKLGADGIIGVNYNYINFTGNLLSVIVNGTAVSFE